MAPQPVKKRKQDGSEQGAGHGNSQTRSIKPGSRDAGNMAQHFKQQ
jgi:hypothetical protein